jgi:hypothetical protein
MYVFRSYRWLLTLLGFGGALLLNPLVALAAPVLISFDASGQISEIVHDPGTLTDPAFHTGVATIQIDEQTYQTATSTLSLEQLALPTLKGANQGLGALLNDVISIALQAIATAANLAAQTLAQLPTLQQTKPPALVLPPGNTLVPST